MIYGLTNGLINLIFLLYSKTGEFVFVLIMWPPFTFLRLSIFMIEGLPPHGSQHGAARTGGSKLTNICLEIMSLWFLSLRLQAANSLKATCIHQCEINTELLSHWGAEADLRRVPPAHWLAGVCRGRPINNLSVTCTSGTGINGITETGCTKELGNLARDVAVWVSMCACTSRCLFSFAQCSATSSGFIPQTPLTVSALVQLPAQQQSRYLALAPSSLNSFENNNFRLVGY